MKLFILLIILGLIFVFFVPGCSRVENSNVYCLRGLGEVFSNGLDKLSDEINKKNIKSCSLSWTEWKKITEKETGDRPLCLIGHSYGADNAVEAAYFFKEKGIVVDHLFLLDSTKPRPIPNNVLNCTHWYVETVSGDTLPDVLPGNPIKLEKGNNITVLENIQVKDRDINHLNIDDVNRIKQYILEKVTLYAKNSI